MEKFPFLRSTLFFSIAGFFIPGFTAIALLGIQILLEKLGVGCVAAMTSVWTVTTVIAIGLPVLFDRWIKKRSKGNFELVGNRLIIFNLIQYTVLQSSLAVLFTNPNTLCYVGDGQNGMELVFTAWLGLPILWGISFFFDQRLKRVNKDD